MYAYGHNESPSLVTKGQRKMNLQPKPSLVSVSHNNVTNLKRIVSLSENVRAGYTCSVCHLVFKTNGECNMHSLVHNIPMRGPMSQCGTCKRVFGSAAALDKHTSIHTGDKPYICGLCQKSFPTRSKLIYHMRIHTGERPYKFESFLQRYHLTEHSRIHTANKPYKCGLCQKSFSQQHYLTKHSLAHTGEKSF